MRCRAHLIVARLLIIACTQRRLFSQLLLPLLSDHRVLGFLLLDLLPLLLIPHSDTRLLLLHPLPLLLPLLEKRRLLRPHLRVKRPLHHHALLLLQDLVRMDGTLVLAGIKERNLCILIDEHLLGAGVCGNAL